MIAGILLGVGIVVGLYVIGRVVGNMGNPPNPAVGTNSNELDCENACKQYDQSRVVACNAEKDQATAQARVDGKRTEMLAVLALAVTLVGSAAAAAVLGPPGWIAAAALAAAAAVALAAADVLAGQLGAADVDLATKAKIAQDARAAEGEARKIVGDKCSPERADACLLRPSPC